MMTSKIIQLGYDLVSFYILVIDLTLFIPTYEYDSDFRYT